MADARIALGSNVYGGFNVYTDENVPVTGLVQANFQILVAKDGGHSSVPVTIGETGDGRYWYRFTPSDVGEWFIVIRYAVEVPRGWSEDLVVYAVSVGTGGGAAPEKYWKTSRPEMSNGFMRELLNRRLAQVDAEERKKLLAIMLVTEEDY